MSIWDEIDEKEYLPFCKFGEVNGHIEVCVQLIDKEPSIFVNRWGKQQYSIRVWKYRKPAKGNLQLESSGGTDDAWLLVGGVRLFRTIKKNKEYDGVLRIRRIGEGFQIRYKVVQKIKIK